MTKETYANEVWYLKSWGAFHVVTGLIFSVIFALGAVMLDEITYFLYLIPSAGIVYMGWVKLRHPYISYTKNQLIVRGTFGDIYKKYIFSDNDRLLTQNNRILLNGEKLKFNRWFTNQHQYKAMLAYFSGDLSPASELQD